MTVSVVREEEMQAPLRLVPPIDPPSPPVDRDAIRIQAISILTGLSAILGARLILLLAVLGAGGLHLLAALSGSTAALVSVGLYDGLALIPVIIFSWQKG